MASLTRRAFDGLLRALTFVGGAALVLMMLHVTLDVVLKNLFRAPIQGTIEISSYYYMVAIVMLPLAFVERTDEQISVDLLFRRLPAPARRAVLAFACLVTAGVLAIMTYRTGLDAVRAWRVGEVVMGAREVVVWPARLMLPVGFGLATAAALLRIVLVARGEAIADADTPKDVA
ncbi:TRAP transporter small permease subunit [Salinarimonas rosea]|uniref:TRAP transporter small permease subunit n=1 Tax=Salinarimonas rosea TaxID=552063 RepID=UPI0006935E2F|nr:TRAP transporter small permease [Salinarimonas rosea]